MNELRESNEGMRQTTDELKKQQDELKDLIDRLNKEKNDWVRIGQNLFVVILLWVVFLGEKIRSGSFGRKTS